MTPQSLDQTQSPILQNFVSINNAFYFNHVQYNDGSGFQGKHTYVQMPVQIVTSGPPQSPGYPFAVTDTALYSVSSLVTGKSELAFVRGTGASIGTVPQTFEISSYGTGSYTFNASAQGSISYNYVWTRFTSGLLQLWGTQTTFGPAIGGSGLIMLYPPINNSSTTNSFPGFTTAVYNVQISTIWANAVASSNNLMLFGPLTTTQFQYSRNSSGSYNTSGAISFTAIGI